MTPAITQITKKEHENETEHEPQTVKECAVPVLFDILKMIATTKHVRQKEMKGKWKVVVERGEKTSPNKPLNHK
jgi:hypothetical protein